MNDVKLYADIDLSRLPRHVAIIMDGNGRWAKQHSMKIALGHRAGTETVREIIRSSNDLGIEALTLYAFSTENWSRPRTEVEALMQLIVTFFNSDLPELIQKNVHVTILGDKGTMPLEQKLVLEQAEERTRQNTGMKLNFAINYGGRAELCRAVREIAALAASGSLKPEEITEETLASHLYTAGIPDVDVMIRTSGEMRLSNFLLYQCAYAEFLFPPDLWPDFTVKRYHECLAEFQKRSRRFGKREE